MVSSFVQVIEETVRGLGYDVIEVRKSPGGLLSVTMDWPYVPETVSEQSLQVITVQDCEKVTRQLQYVLEVEGVDYRRLEVSSPGIDRRLRDDADLKRFTGYTVDIVLKEGLGGQAAQGLVAANRKKFRGILEAADQGWRLLWSDEPPPKSGVRVSAKRAARTYRSLEFVFADLQEVRLAPIVNFKKDKKKS